MHKSLGFKNCVYSRYSHRLKESLDQNFLDAIQVEETSDNHLYGRLEVYCVETNTILHSPRRLTRFCCFENVMNDMKVEIQEELNRSTIIRYDGMSVQAISDE